MNRAADGRILPAAAAVTLDLSQPPPTPVDWRPPRVLRGALLEMHVESPVGGETGGWLRYVPDEGLPPVALHFIGTPVQDGDTIRLETWRPRCPATGRIGEAR